MVDQALLYWALTGLALTVGSMGVYIANNNSKHSKEIKGMTDEYARKMETLLVKSMDDSTKMTTAVENNSKVMLKVLEMLKP